MKKTTIAILFLCILAFIASAIINLKGTQDAHMLSLLSADESIQYPYLIHMLSGGSSAFETIKNFMPTSIIFTGSFLSAFCSIHPAGAHHQWD
jgi:hypothetical protein